MKQTTNRSVKDLLIKNSETVKPAEAKRVNGTKVVEVKAKQVKKEVK